MEDEMTRVITVRCAPTEDPIEIAFSSFEHIMFRVDGCDLY
jgi:hypothetical protein